MKLYRILILLILIPVMMTACASAAKDEAAVEDAISGVKSPVTEKEIPKEDGAAASGVKKSDMLRSDAAEPESEGFGSDDIVFEEYESLKGLPELAAAGPAPGYTAGGAVPSQSGLKAGFSDDNRQFGYFLGFLDEYREWVQPLDLDVSERILLKITDSDGKSAAGVRVSASAEKGSVTGITLADGSFQVNPAELFSSAAGEPAEIMLEIVGGDVLPGFYKKTSVSRDGERMLTLAADVQRSIPNPVPLDLVFVMDTTGSMGEEIARLKNTIQIIHMNLSSLTVAADIRFGMVLYKDVEDEYRTQVIPLTSDLDEFRSSLDAVEAFGGGDTPEDLEAALNELINTIEWNPDAVKLSYVITDAPPHLDYQSSYTCSDAARDAREAGIKIFGIGTGGLDIQGEYVLRQIAQYTSARYIFLTYGAETGESEGGVQGSVSHHTGSNWSSDKLESIIIRFTKEELAFLSDEPLPEDEPWFEAGKIEDEKAEDTLANLFGQAIDQLLDYSTISLTKKNYLAVLPFDADQKLAANAEYFNEHLILAAGESDRIGLAERKDIAQLLGEIELQNLGLTDDQSVVEIGEFLNADALLIGNLYLKGKSYELFLKLLRVETSEVLSVTRAVIDTELGL